jgi:pimeloyl-ACP methyl ester carboxylesterase
MDSLGIEDAILVGNSAGGNVAAQTALAHPDRVEGLVLVDASIYGYGAAKDLVQGVLSAPIIQTVGPVIARIAAHFGTQVAHSSWHDPAKVPPETRSAYQRQMLADHWDFGFWEAGRVGLPDDLAHRVDELDLPTLVITGDNDGVVPTEDSVRLAGELPNAQLAIMADCGHVPNEECPDQFIQATSEYLDSLKPTT